MAKQGVFETAIRRALERYKHTRNLYRLCVDMIDIGDKIQYAWMRGHAIDMLYKCFKEILPEHYVVEEL